MASDRDESPASESSEESVYYDIERILAQEEFNGQMLYLVKWQGYAEEQCTWEPSENFSDPQTLREWQQRLDLGDTLDEEGIATLQIRMDEYTKRQEEEEQLRASKRRRLIKGRKPHNSSASVSLSSSDSDTPQSLSMSKPSIASVPKPIFVRGTANCNSSIPTPASLQEARSSKSSSDSVPNQETHNTQSPFAQALPPPSEVQPTLQSHRKQPPSNRTGVKPRRISTTSPTGVSNEDPTPRSNGNGRPAESRAGQNFKNLKHRNNYMKKSHREGVPDISQMQLIPPEDWNQRPIKAQPAIAPAQTTESWLFLPADGNITIASPSPIASSSDQAMQLEGQNPDTLLQLGGKKSSVDDPMLGKHSNVQSSKSDPVLLDLGPVQPDQTSNFSVNPASSSGKTNDLQPHAVQRQGNASNLPLFDQKDTQPNWRVTFSANSTTSLDSRKVSQPPQLQRRESASNLDLSDLQDKQQNERESFSVSSTTSLEKRKDAQPTVVNPFQPLLRRQSTSTMSLNPEHYGNPDITTRSGRSFKKGAEVLVHLSLNGHSVGDVKLLHIPHWLTKKLIVLKAPGEVVVRIDFPQQEVRTRAEYSDLMRDCVKPAIVVGEIQPYEDTAASLDKLADYLEKESVCALWIYPDPSETVVMILYSQAAPRWRDLGQQMVKRAHNSRLRFLIYNTTTSFYHRLRIQDQTPSRQGVGPITDTGTQNKAQVTRNNANLEMTSSRNRRWSMDLQSKNKFDSHYRDTLARDIMIQRDPPTKIDLSNKDYETRTLSTADFDYLTTSSSRTRIESKHARVFIAFDGTHPREARIIRQWLSEHVASSRNIFSDTEKNGWEEFCEASDRKIGVLLFHEKVSSYTSLPRLSSWLRREGPACFNVTFNETTGKISFSRIFARGTVLALTESCMTGYLDQTLYMVRWFEAHSKGKSASWRLLLFPNAIEHCFQRLAVPGVSNDLQKTLAEILAIILRLRHGSGCQAMNPGEYIGGGILDRQQGTDDSFIVSPNLSSSLGTMLSPNGPALRARDRLFLQYVLGWASMKCTQYRRFILVDDTMRNQSEPHSSHVHIIHPERFEAEHVMRT